MKTVITLETHAAMEAQAATGTLGSFITFEDLAADERALVQETWNVAKNAYVPLSHFPVGATLLAQNPYGQTKVFRGCNVENRFFQATICAERNAATTAIAEGYTRFLKVALVLQNYQGPGASPCGLCRQVLLEFGSDAVVLQVADKQSNVYRYRVGDLLPAAGREPVACTKLDPSHKRAVRRLKEALARAYAPYSQKPRAAVCIADDENGRTRQWLGLTDENASYGGSAAAECVAMRNARSAGFTRNATLVVAVHSLSAPNPIEGECLQVLREFGPDAKVILVDGDAAVHSSVSELLPDSFGPQALS